MGLFATLTLYNKAGMLSPKWQPRLSAPAKGESAKTGRRNKPLWHGVQTDMRIRLTLILLAGLGIALAETQLPVPTGAFPVGRQTLFWSDPSRTEEVGPSTGKPREIAAYVFYPAVAQGKHVEYYPGLAGLENAPETRILRQQFGAAWSAVTTGTIQTNASPRAGKRRRWPIWGEQGGWSRWESEPRENLKVERLGMRP